MKAKAKDANTTVQVGYSQKYAVSVHEVPANHKVGQAKYLEQPARQFQKDLGRIIAVVYKKTKSMKKALLLAGFRLQRESQLLVPIDTSALRASAYVATEEEADIAAQASFNKSEKLKVAGQRKRDKEKKKKGKK